jgi:hypothetical protein
VPRMLILKKETCSAVTTVPAMTVKPGVGVDAAARARHITQTLSIERVELKRWS